jgi:hypothetical protein
MLIPRNRLARNLAKGWLGHVWDPSSPSAAKVDAICSIESSA